MHDTSTQHEHTGTAARRNGVVAALVAAVLTLSPHLVTVGRAVVNLPMSAAGVIWVGRTVASATSTAT